MVSRLRALRYGGLLLVLLGGVSCDDCNAPCEAEYDDCVDKHDRESCAAERDRCINSCDSESSYQESDNGFSYRN